MLKEIKIELTNKCYRNCRHCSSNGIQDETSSIELSINDVKRIINECHKMDIKKIVFTGGEPLLYTQLPDLISLSKAHGISTSIYSFAFRTDDYFKKFKDLIDAGLSKIVYSLADTLSTNKPDTEKEIKCFFDDLLSHTKTKLGFHYTITNNSYLYYKNIVTKTLNDFRGCDYFDNISLLRFVPHGRGTKEMDLTVDQINDLNAYYLSLANKDKKHIRFGSPWNILGISSHKCTIADEVMIIGYDGIAYPCDSVKYMSYFGISGNISTMNLNELYNSKYFKKIRELKDITCSNNDCELHGQCKSGCLGQKIISCLDNKGKLDDIRDKKIPDPWCAFCSF